MIAPDGGTTSMARGIDTGDHPRRKVGRMDLENTLRSILIAPFEAHAGFMSHPEDEPPLNMADGLAEENQWGAVHVNKNISEEDRENMHHTAMQGYRDKGIDPATRDVRL